MRSDPCSRIWEVEALLDGRLSDVEADSTRRHVAQCAICSHELSEQERVRDRIRASLVPEISPLERRRLRANLLRRANEKLTRHERRPIARWLAIVPVAVTVLLLVRLVHRTPPAITTPTPVVSAMAPVAPIYEVLDSGGAKWFSSNDGPRTKVTLSDGTASFAVRHLTPEQRFSVDLPDGTIEVRGTRFVVDVKDRRTRRIEVSEGLVSFRPKGDDERPIPAGETWVAKTDAPPITVADLPAPRPREPGPVDPAARFDDAMKDFKARRYLDADDELRTFIRDFPRDPRSEDAAFLRAVAHSRSGDADGAATLAKEYLDRYPRGLRRAEAERLRAP